MKLKDNKGVTGVDLAISLMVIMIFVSFIAALFSNLSTTSKNIERKATATNLAIEVIEAMKITEFENLSLTAQKVLTTNKELTNKIDTQTGTTTIEIPSAYQVKITVKNPKSSEDNATSDEILGEEIKIIAVEVSYSTGKDLDKDGNKDLEVVKIETLVKNIQ